MVKETRVKVYLYKGRYSINLPSDFATDSAFPFKPLEDLKASIEGERIIIERFKQEE
jgi:hypothetical protein